MNDKLLLAVDLGTSFIKTAVYDLNGTYITGTKVACEDEKPEPGVVIQRGEKLFDAVVDCMEGTVKGMEPADVMRIAAISFTGQMAGFMGVDADWNDVTTWSCFIDARYVPYADRQMELYADKFLQISGTNAPLMGPKIEWFQTEFPEEAKRIRKYMMISSYIIGRLGGMPIEDAVMETSFLSWTGLGDLSDVSWSEEICGLLGVNMEHLPRLVKPNEIVGSLCAEMAVRTGLPAGLPLVAGAGDKIAGCVGAAVQNPGEAIFEAGSYGAISCMTEDFRVNVENDYYDIIPAAHDLLCIHKYIPGSGITLDWFVSNFYGERPAKEVLAEMEEKVAEIPPGSDGLWAIGLLGGNAMPFAGNIKGEFAGFTWTHKVEHFYRALLESYAYDLALTLEAAAEQYPEYAMDTLKIIGGGARSRTWVQIMADVTGRAFQILDRDDVALWGASMLGANAIGLLPDMKQHASDTVHVKETIYPDQKNHEIYQDMVKEYKNRLEERMKKNDK